MADELVFAAETADSHRSSLSRRPAASRLRLTPKRLTWRMLGMLMVCWPDSSQCGSLTLLHPCRLLLTKMHVPETYESRKRSFFLRCADPTCLEAPPSGLSAPPWFLEAPLFSSWCLSAAYF